MLPLPTLRLLLRECMEWFWDSSDCLQPNWDPYPCLNLKTLLGPLYWRPPRVADREKGLKVVGIGRLLRPRKPLVDCRLFRNDVLLSYAVADHLAGLRLGDRGPERMDKSV